MRGSGTRSGTVSRTSPPSVSGSGCGAKTGIAGFADSGPKYRTTQARACSRSTSPTIETGEAGFFDEIQRICREPISLDELARAKALIETDELGALQRVGERADRLSMYATLLDDPGEINRQLERYLAVEPEAVRAACAEVFVPDNRVVLTYVPAEAAAATTEAA